MDFPKVAACGTGMAEVVRGTIFFVSTLIGDFCKNAKNKIRD